MLSAEARKSVVEAYTAGKLTKVIAHDHGISPQSVSEIAKQAGIQHRRPYRQTLPRPVDDVAVLRLFREGLDTVSIAARLMTTQAVAAKALACARDRGRAR